MYTYTSIATAALCVRDVRVLLDGSGGKTVMLPKIFKWFASDFGENKLQILRFIADHLQHAPRAAKAGDSASGAATAAATAAATSPATRAVQEKLANELYAVLATQRDSVRIRYSDFDWTKRAYGRPP